MRSLSLFYTPQKLQVQHMDNRPSEGTELKNMGELYTSHLHKDLYKGPTYTRIFSFGYYICRRYNVSQGTTFIKHGLLDWLMVKFNLQSTMVDGICGLSHCRLPPIDIRQWLSV
uniref:Uncharacterized protein n=1 Tax=Arundo donax TaxID=35708 RepID=A0A0A9DA60_ARUDO